MKTIFKGISYIAYCAVAAAATMIGMLAGPKIYADAIEPQLDKVFKKTTSKD